MPMKSLRALASLSAVAALACSSPTGTEPRQLRVIATANTVTMENPNAWPVFYIVANPNFLALADFALCEDPASNCPRVPAKGTAHVAYADIAGYEVGETEATLMEWRLERQLDGSYRAKDFQTTTVQLH
jgi:hypothetical protein